MADDSTLANAIILIIRAGMGPADAALQHKLLDTYLRLLVEKTPCRPPSASTLPRSKPAKSTRYELQAIRPVTLDKQ